MFADLQLNDRPNGILCQDFLDGNEQDNTAENAGAGTTFGYSGNFVTLLRCGNHLAARLVRLIYIGLNGFMRQYRDGKRYQSVEIYYNGVGIIREPSPEEMEEYFHEHLKRKAAKAAKTA